jgi:hypothetical protein
MGERNAGCILILIFAMLLLGLGALLSKDAYSAYQESIQAAKRVVRIHHARGLR